MFLGLFHHTEDIYIELDGEIIGKYDKDTLPDDYSYFPINGARLEKVNGIKSLICEIGYEYLGDKNPFEDGEKS